MVSTGAAERAWCVVVPHDATGARLARHRLADELAGVVPPMLLADLVAVLAELVGNAVRHADPLPGGVVRVAWRLRTSTEGQQVQLRVTDGGAVGEPRVRAADPDAIDGRGLHIVSGLADRWGVERDGLGQSVWAEFDPTDAARPDLVAAG
ncbi:ATP-binding protein [Micromonospora phytophila]|uniref:ATP-binding protein n=1 Tax=Micromonospora phytophila TaxID=709888 RepID=UPI002030809E|nr:ATP-binding protein [Micromonospora phytophila]MCM0675169.1 ATP-binding protein [Micromonospora phytophila]